MHSFSKIDAHWKSEVVPGQNILDELKYPDITIPNRTLAWSLHGKSETSAEVQAIKNGISEYNAYIETLKSLENFEKIFVKKHYCLQKTDAISLWGTEAAEKIFGLKTYVFETPLRINGKWLFAPNIIPVYEANVEGQKLSFEVGPSDSGYPEHNSDGSKSFLWNWMSDYRDFCFYLWQIFDYQGWLPDESGDEEPIKSYYGFSCYGQHRYVMEEPDVNLWRCFQILMDSNYLKAYELQPEEENPWWNTRGTRGTITLGVLDMTFLKNKVQKDKIKLVLGSSEEDVKSHKYILLDTKKHPYLSNEGAQYGGHYKLKIYGQLNCPSAKKFLEKGEYAQQRVFFRNQEDAIATGFRPCAVCMPEAYAKWKESGKEKA